MTPEEERQNAIRGMRFVASDTARIRKARKDSTAAYRANVCVYCSKCGRALLAGSPIGSRCVRCDDTVALEKTKTLEKKKVINQDHQITRINFFCAGIIVGSVLTLILKYIYG